MLRVRVKVTLRRQQWKAVDVPGRHIWSQSILANFRWMALEIRSQKCNFSQVSRVIVKVVGRSILEWLTAMSTATEVIYSNFGELDFTSNHV